jgi:hypothetical protein
VDAGLVNAVIDRDWAPFVAQLNRLALGQATREDARIDIVVRPPAAEADFLAVLICDEYDDQAPVLHFANPAAPAEIGAEHWPRIDGAPMNAVTWNGANLPIICVVGTRGYHIHPSHVSETHPKSCWQLPAVATVLHRFLHMGAYRGRGV